MFTPKSPPEPTSLDKAIESALLDLNSYNAEDEKYQKATDQIVKLHKLKETEKPPKVSPDTLAIIAGNLVAVLIVVSHERAHVITTKVWGFLLKMK